MSFGAAGLRAALEEQLPAAATGLVVSLSGGGDSACLLTALAQAGHGDGHARRVCGLPLRALHVDHGLQPMSEAFREASAALCRGFDIPFGVLRAAVCGDGVSIEAAAREARYAALARELERGECLLTAHHAEDQAETLLLQLLRGAGLKGLCAMPACRPFAVGWHLRPLLGVTRAQLRAFGALHGVAFLEDPMNQDQRFDRSFLRSELWPRIEMRWPGAARSLSRSARHLAEAQELSDRADEARLGRLRDGEALSIAGLRGLPESEQRSVLRYWLRAAGVEPPSSSRLEEALRQARGAGDDRLPAVIWGGHALRRYHGRLYVTAAVPPRLGEPCEWFVGAGEHVDLGPALGRLCWQPKAGGFDRSRLPGRLSVRRRRGGEVMRIGRGARTQSVQHLCQSRGVTPWMRDALPMLYAGERLIGVGDLWQDADWCVPEADAGLGCVWRDAPRID